MSSPDVRSELQAWYSAQCDGEWDHGWPLIESDPDGWPNDTPEPKPRPTESGGTSKSETGPPREQAKRQD